MLVGLCGPMQSGKDTAAQHFVNTLNFGQRAFKDKMVEVVCALFDIKPEQYEKFKLEATILLDIQETYDHPYSIGSILSETTGRQFLERLGTEVGRNMFGYDFWVDRTMQGVRGWDNIVFSDVRFPNEAEAIKDLGGCIIEILRKGTDYDDSHESRMRLPENCIDFTVYNEGSIEDLHGTLDGILNLHFA